VMRMSVCLSVRLSAGITRKPHGRFSPNFLCMLTIAVARSFSDGVAIRYVLPVLWMTLCLHIVILWYITPAPNRRQNITSVTAEITTTFCSATKTESTQSGLCTGAKSAIYNCLVVDLSKCYASLCIYCIQQQVDIKNRLITD